MRNMGCENYGVSFIELSITRPGLFNEPRSIAVYLLRQIRSESLNTIGGLFNIKAYSIVSSITRRISRLRKYGKGYPDAGSILLTILPMP